MPREMELSNKSLSFGIRLTCLQILSLPSARCVTSAWWLQLSESHSPRLENGKETASPHSGCRGSTQCAQSRGSGKADDSSAGGHEMSIIPGHSTFCVLTTAAVTGHPGL